MSAKSTATKKKGFWKIIFYVVISIITLMNALTIFTYIVLNHKMIQWFSHVPSSVFYIYGLLGWGNIFAMIALFKSRRFGLWIFLGVAIATIILNLVGRMNIFLAFSGLIGPLIVYLLMRPFWKEFK